MHLHSKINLSDTHQFSNLYIDYIQRSESLESFYHLFPELISFGKAIREKKIELNRRELLSDVLLSQYNNLVTDEIVKDNIIKLKDEKTYTVTTGHQLCIYTGPLYFILKILTTIKLSRILKEAYPAYTFIPVFWMASEDHDFEEINHFYVKGKKYDWATSQEGPVGRFKIQELKSLVDQFPDIENLFHEAYLNHDTLTEATRFIINTLFGQYGLLCLDGDDKLLKKSITDFICDDVFNNTAYNTITESSISLKKKGYKLQVHPREINYFFLGNGKRERIEFIKEKYHIAGAQNIYSEKELYELIFEQPENFSPNVVTRPLYQELVLPNLAYIGGPGEIAYWLQLKGYFSESQVQFPILVPRSHVSIIEKRLENTLEKVNIDPKEIFIDVQKLKETYLIKNNAPLLNPETYIKELSPMFEEIKSKVSTIDITLNAYVESQKNETYKLLNRIERKTIRALQKKESIHIDQILKIRNILLPDGLLQERKENIMGFYQENFQMIKDLLKIIEPFDFRFNFLIE